MAHEISREDLDHVEGVFEQTATLWESYAPERTAPDNRAKDDFVGWSSAGAGPCSTEDTGVH